MDRVRYLSEYRLRKALKRDPADYLKPPVYPPGSRRYVLRLEMVCEDDLDEHMIEVHRREIRDYAVNRAWTVTEWIEDMDGNPNRSPDDDPDSAGV
ncbi:MAG TPA: hypothetical protein VHX38_13515 [Pseudonocardiaceae bacterium]|nr:hypothetical protein [Pseudonocardiaceae bacterium]